MNFVNLSVNPDAFSNRNRGKQIPREQGPEKNIMLFRRCGFCNDQCRLCNLHFCKYYIILFTFDITYIIRHINIYIHMRCRKIILYYIIYYDIILYDITYIILLHYYIILYYKHVIDILKISDAMNPNRTRSMVSSSKTASALPFLARGASTSAGSSSPSTAFGVHPQIMYQ